MELRSPDFMHLEAIPPRFTCDGENVSPALQWSDLPGGVEELAITCEDADAPGRTFVHWVLWGIDPRSRTDLEAGEMPPGAYLGRNDFGDNAYGGPCPPPGHGPHRYRFTLFALGRRLSLPDGATIDELRGAIAESSPVAEAVLIGTYER